MIELTDIQKRFILHWGEMGAKWGINRTVAQVHALLYLSPRPLDAEEITDTLAVARSNVSGSLRELQGWGIVKMVHVMNDRRDHFESMKDPWEMFRVVLDEWKKREIDPTLAMLREALEEMKCKAWLKHPADLDLVFRDTQSDLWQEILKKMGWQYRLLAEGPDDLSRN